MPSDLDEAALGHWLNEAVPASGAITSVEKFFGGQSNPTYKISASGGDFVLRRKPFGKLLTSAHAVDREFRLIKALHPTGFPVPKPIALCNDEGVIGAVFYIMELVKGRVFWEGGLPELSAPERRLAYEALIDTMARLHNISIENVGLQDYGKPGDYFARQVDRWSKQYRASQTEDIREVDALIEWLPQSAPLQTRTSIIHGDYRIDNLIFRSDDYEIAAVLDWELSTLGDPLADFTYVALNWVTPHTLGRSNIGGLDIQSLGIPSLDEITERYCAATRIERPPQLEWYFAFNLFRILGIIQGIKKRLLDGNASNANAAAAVSAMPHIIAAAWHFAQKAGATY